MLLCTQALLHILICSIKCQYVARRACLYFSSDAICITSRTTLVCTGSGILTQDIVRAAGDFSTFTKAIIKNDISVLGGNAFLWCSSLTDVELPNSLVEMQGGSFDACSIVNLSIPESVTTISSCVVNNCGTFQNFMVNGCADGTLQNHVIQNGFILSKDLKTLIASPTGKMAGDTLKLPDVLYVGDACRWSRAKRIEIPDTVLEVRSNAFYRASMESLKLGKAVASFSTLALGSCLYLTTIDIGSNTNFFMSDYMFGKGSSSNPDVIIKVFEGAHTIRDTNPMMSIGTSALQLCPTLKSITFKAAPSGKSAIYRSLMSNQLTARYITFNGNSEWAIDGCVGGAESIDLGMFSATEQNTYKWIYTEAFRGCKLLKSLKLHSKVTKIGQICRECQNLTEFSFAGCYCGNSGKPGTNGDNVIPGMCFYGSALERILEWPSSEFSMGREVFVETKLTEIVLPTGLMNIGSLAFYGISTLTKIVFNDKIKIINTGGFHKCYNLTTVEFSSSSQLQIVESTAFALCTSLTTITFPDTVTSISSASFTHSGLTSIKFISNTGTYRSDGIGCYKCVSGNAYRTLVICPSGLNEFKVSKQTLIISTSAFYCCNKLMNIDMSNVEEVQDTAFYDCGSLTSIRFPVSIKSIGRNAIDSCNSLIHVFYCGIGGVSYTPDPFPTDIHVYVTYDYPEATFCGHLCTSILDSECNIPTGHFTPALERSTKSKYYYSACFFVYVMT